jgi:hypothetical protein
MSLPLPLLAGTVAGSISTGERKDGLLRCLELGRVQERYSKRVMRPKLLRVHLFYRRAPFYIQ